MRLAEEKSRFINQKTGEEEATPDDNDFEAVEKQFEEKNAFEQLKVDGLDDDESEADSANLDADFVDGENSEVEDPEDAISEENLEEEKEDAMLEETNVVDDKKVEEKKEEVLDPTVFIRNIPLECDEKELYDFFKKIGKIFYAKICKNPNDEYHKGTGFVKFKDADLAKKLVKISEEMSRGTYKPAAEDPILEMEGEILMLYPALSRDNIKGKVTWRQEVDEKKKKDPNFTNATTAMRNINSLEELIESDKQGKRNLQLSIKGLYKSTDKMVKNNMDKSQREIHENQKLAKLKNPNTFVSDTKIFIKNVDRTLNENQVKSCVFETLGLKKITRKILKKTQLYFDVETNNFNGSLHLEFIKPEDALSFITNIESDDKTYSLFNMKRVPIIEFALENAQKVLKHEQILKSVQQKTNQRKKAIIDEKIQNKEKHGDKKMKAKLDEANTIKKGQIENNKKVVKLRLAEIEDGTVKPTPKQIKDLIDLVHGRGTKQRLKQKLRDLGHLKTENIIVPKQSHSDFIKQRKDKQENVANKKEKHDEFQKVHKKDEKKKEYLAKRMPDDERQVANQIKNRKKQKGKENDKDEFDEMAENYMTKKVKKPKWFSM